ncbi:hypothetical protein phiPsa347_150 [Pseudomonas phage phiPsa347]|uniref:Uncharacterized protein n=1 Tax=Pseudomonas phage phiPsa347 TaxID=1460364 RepID=A0A7G9V2I2_9CAUD|nr:hypothetical protein QGX18_gp078 [Pseudomonas phage phiPsa347]QNO00488.1 hypothetical protein phiPsa347_150 [Pseudomonas phage phiPsa347]
MIVSEMIEWLQSMPQDAKVQVLEHHGGGGYYTQGGECYTADFTTKVDYQQWKEPGDDSPVEYIYGDHFELSKLGDELILQIGVKDK